MEQNQTAVATATQYNLSKIEDIKQFSSVLRTYIEENQLSTEISGNKYVNVDGWKFAGLNFGLTAIPGRRIWSRNLQQ